MKRQSSQPVDRDAIQKQSQGSHWRLSTGHAPRKSKTANKPGLPRIVHSVPAANSEPIDRIEAGHWTQSHREP
ncbi:uncharacterized protein N7473_000059 [Penicillium subrubescens]|uniref:uncharacterized protein n=1 Tax=Penicillium subrubescens TaxID=1316194 RepID=UPI002545A429|nr:uncharacterized protein N7473_000059 [Penicillium subrubescens]KAJ5910756.1 hypothetical protein N7473_000059 [Penicillium subrubescens]